MVTTQFEQEYWKHGMRYVAGVDEAGRGPLAGPVVAAAVVLSPDSIIEGIDDSKKLPQRKREELYAIITNQAIGYGISVVHHAVIDEINILQATFKAMHEAVALLQPQPGQLLIDGNKFKANGIPFRTIIDGDALSVSIAAASILAKVTRDAIMTQYDKEFPAYGFAKHKGYGTKEHIAAIKTHGYCEIHRKSFHLRSEQLKLFKQI